MTEYELAVYMVDAFGVDADDAHAAIRLFRERGGKVSPFTLHDKFEWPPEVCSQIVSYLEERLAA